MTERLHLHDADKFTLDKTGFTWAYFCRQTDPVIHRDLLKELEAACFEHQQSSLRICLHPSPQSPLHEMVIVQRSNSYSPPHKHQARDETIQVLQGDMAAVLFEEDGRIRETLLLASGSTFLLRVSRQTYHLLMPLTDIAIFSESRLGPFCAEDTLFASWAPGRADLEEAESYKRELRFLLQAPGIHA